MVEPRTARARAAFRELENGNEEYLAIWQLFKDISLREYTQTYKRLGIEFDVWDGESLYTDKMPAIVEELREKELLKKIIAAFEQKYPLKKCCKNCTSYNKKKNCCKYKDVEESCVMKDFEEFEPIRRQFKVVDFRPEITKKSESWAQKPEHYLISRIDGYKIYYITRNKTYAIKFRPKGVIR